MENKTSTNNENGNDGNTAVFTCDHCEEEWGIGFKCNECSDKIITVQSELPNLHWSGYPIEDEYVMGDENVSTGNVCGNCCSCHENGS